jgi:hypothetical protein
VFTEKNLELTLAGKIVLSIGAAKSDLELGLVDPDIKYKLDILHMWKIILADEVLCLNVGGYIGESTRREIEFARIIGRPVAFLEPENKTAKWKQFHSWPPEIVEAMMLVVASSPAEVPWVASRALLPPEVVRGTMGCGLQGCGVNSPMVNQTPTDDGWCRYLKGGVFRWFCTPGHLTQYARERKLGNWETPEVTPFRGTKKGISKKVAPLEVLREREVPRTRADHYYLEHGVDPYREPWYDGLTIRTSVVPGPPRDAASREALNARRRAERDRINAAKGRETRKDHYAYKPREPVEETTDAP